MKYPWPRMAELADSLSDCELPKTSFRAGERADHCFDGREFAKPLDGNALAKQIKSKLAQRVVKLHEAGHHPGLATVLVGDDPASQVYVGWKHRDCEEIGLESIDVRLPATASQAEVLSAVDQLNENPQCTGMIVQLPLPKGLNQQEVLERIDPAKDADGLHPYNLGLLVSSISLDPATPQPCTPRGIIALLEANGIDLSGKEVCVVGRGLTVGRPMGLLLTRKNVNATCISCHTGTRDLEAHLRRADVVIAAAGVPGIIRAEHLQPGVVVVDVGVSREGKKIVGDVAEGVEEVASYLTPNPGGVGPMTRAMLLANVVETAERMAGLA